MNIRERLIIENEISLQYISLSESQELLWSHLLLPRRLLLLYFIVFIKNYSFKEEINVELIIANEKLFIARERKKLLFEITVRVDHQS
jgi:hypothetical protein